MADEYLSLPYVTIRLFIQPGDLAAAEAHLHALRGGDKRADLAAAVAVAASFAKGYRIEYMEAGEQPAAVPSVTVRRSPFSGWQA